MLKMVRCGGLRSFIRNVHCDSALAIAISIVGCGPSSSRAVKSTMYDSEMQELPMPIGMSALSAELMTDTISSAANSPGRGNCSCGNDVTTARPPRAMTTHT